jgi:hypothetical protein
MIRLLIGAYRKVSPQARRMTRIGTDAGAATAAAAMVTGNDPLKRLMQRIVEIPPPVSTTIAVAVSSRVSFEAKVFVDQVVGSGCTPILAYVALEDPDVGTWGTAYGAIFFKSDGMLYAAPENGLNGNVALVPYVAGRWYHVLVNADLTARSFDVFIDGVLAASDIPIVDTGMPKGVEVTTGHGANPVVWFDDVKVNSLPSAP